MIDVSIRLRRAIHSNDLPLLKRILKSNPAAIRNPDFSEKSNTSLHLAAKLGCADILSWLIEAGHEDDGISLNTEFETPLMTACEAKQVEVGQILISTFPHCIGWTNKNGMDALMLASRIGALPLLSLLLTTSPPASTAAQDKDGNTALHYASASGELKALRLLLQYGASPLAQNSYSWTPIAYSATVAAEAYFKQLVAEMERRRVEVIKEREQQQQREMMRPGTGMSNNSSVMVGGVRLVPSSSISSSVGAGAAGGGNSAAIEDAMMASSAQMAAAAAAQQARAGMRTPTMDGSAAANRTGSAAGFRGRLESFGERMEWTSSPAAGLGSSYSRPPITPTDTRAGFDFNVGPRRRAGSDD